MALIQTCARFGVSFLLVMFQKWLKLLWDEFLLKHDFFVFYFKEAWPLFLFTPATGCVEPKRMSFGGSFFMNMRAA